VAEAMAWIRLAVSAEISGINNFLRLKVFIISHSGSGPWRWDASDTPGASQRALQ